MTSDSDGPDLAYVGPERLLPMPAGSGEAAFLVHAADGQLYLVSGYESGGSLRIDNLTSTTFVNGIQMAAVSRDARCGQAGEGASALLYTIDAFDQLHIARQDMDLRDERVAFKRWVLTV